MKEEFCHCDHCNKPIFVGEKCITVTISKDHIDTSWSVEPLNAIGAATWHLECAPAGMAKHELLRKYQSEF